MDKADRNKNIAMYVIRTRYQQTEKVLSKFQNKYVGRNIDETLVSCNICLSKMDEEIIKGHVTKEDVEHMKDKLLRTVGTLLFAKCKFLGSKAEMEAMLKCFLGLSRYQMSDKQRVHLTNMSLHIGAENYPKLRAFIRSYTLRSDLDLCYTTNLKLRMGVATFGYTENVALDVTDMIKLGKKALNAAKRVNFVPWTFVCLTNLLYCHTRCFGFRRMVNYRYRPYTIFRPESIQEVRINVIRTLDELIAFMPRVCDLALQRFVTGLTAVIREQVDCVELPRTPKCKRKKSVFFPGVRDPLLKLKFRTCALKPLRPVVYEKIK